LREHRKRALESGGHWRGHESVNSAKASKERRVASESREHKGLKKKGEDGDSTFKKKSELPHLDCHMAGESGADFQRRVTHLHSKGEKEGVGGATSWEGERLGRPKKTEQRLTICGSSKLGGGGAK